MESLQYFEYVLNKNSVKLQSVQEIFETFNQPPSL